MCRVETFKAIFVILHLQNLLTPLGGSQEQPMLHFVVEVGSFLSMMQKCKH